MAARTFRSISIKLLSAVLVTSSVVTLFITAFQIFLDYQRDISSIEKNLSIIEHGSVDGVAKALWEFDNSQLTIQIDGLMKIPDIAFTEVIENGKTKIQRGKRPESKFISKTFNLNYNENTHEQNLGQLVVVANLENVTSRLYSKVILIFFSQLFKTLLVSIILLFIIRRFLVRHIEKITQYLKKVKIGDNPEILSIDRGQENHATYDELDTLVDVINKMNGALNNVYCEMKQTNENLESEVSRRTEVIIRQRQSLEYTAKMSALGEMAGGIAHEINTPLAAIRNISGQLQEVVDDEPLDKVLLKDMAMQVENVTDRIAEIIRGLRSFSRDGSKDPFQSFSVYNVIQDTLRFCNERFRNSGVPITVDEFNKDLCVEGRATEIAQVLLNLLSNAYDAIVDSKERWIKISVLDLQELVEIQVTDSGKGISADIRDRIFQPFFTTKEIGKGTGMGLSISSGIMKKHNGDFVLDHQCPNTRFVIRLLKKQNSARVA